MNHLVVKSYGCLNDSCSTTLNKGTEELLLQMTTQDLTEDRPLSITRRKVHCKHREMPL